MVARGVGVDGEAGNEKEPGVSLFFGPFPGGTGDAAAVGLTPFRLDPVPSRAVSPLYRRLEVCEG
jgi:hypothetical protein